MDQKVLAGVGNVYRAEVLFRHRIHPLRPGTTLRVGPVARDVGRPGRAHGGGRAHRSHRHGPARAPARGDGAGAAEPTTTAARSTSTAARRCRATSAARPSGPASWSDATSSGVRDVSPRSAPAPYSLRPGSLAHREELGHDCSLARGEPQPVRAARVPDPRRAGRGDARHRGGDLPLPRRRAAGRRCSCRWSSRASCWDRASCRGSWCSCCWCWPWSCRSRPTSPSASCSR